MNKRKRMVSILAGFMAAVLILSLLLSIIPVSAATSDELKEQMEALEEKQTELEEQIAQLESQRTENYGDMQAAVSEKNIIDQEIFLLYSQIDTCNEQIAAYGLMIADKQDELEAAQERLAELNEKNKERIRAMEEDGTLSYWSVLFKANSFADLLDRLNMVEEIAAADQRRLKEMREAAEVVEKAKESLEIDKQALEVSKEALSESQTALEEKRAEADALLADLRARGEEFEVLIDKGEADNAALLEELADLEAEYEEAKYQEWLATSVPPTTAPPYVPPYQPPIDNGPGEGNIVDGVEWLVPCDYVLLTSPYGYRLHPVYGDWRFHSGVDLAGPMGTPIYATRSGVVKAATYNSSAGYYVSIDHQDGFSSSYLHMTHYIVDVGDYVSAGQVIGYMGSTGTSTGSHLHFSIYYNGSSVNPADYIDI